MRRLVIAGLVAGALVVPAPVVASADGPGYRGGCGAYATNDTAPGGPLGGQRVWSGGVWLQVVANDPTATVDAQCWIKFLAGAEQVVLEAAEGTGATAAGGRLVLTADSTDSVYLCAHITLNGSWSDTCVAMTVSCSGAQCTMTGQT